MHQRNRSNATVASPTTSNHKGKKGAIPIRTTAVVIDYINLRLSSRFEFADVSMLKNSLIYIREHIVRGYREENINWENEFGRRLGRTCSNSIICASCLATSPKPFASGSWPFWDDLDLSFQESKQWTLCFMVRRDSPEFCHLHVL